MVAQGLCDLRQRLGECRSVVGVEVVEHETLHVIGVDRRDAFEESPPGTGEGGVLAPPV